MNLSIRFAKIRDVNHLVELDKEAHKEKKWWVSRDRKNFGRRIKQNKKLVFVACIKDKIVGYLQGTFRFEKEALWVEDIYVKKEYRKMGIAKLLVKTWKKEGKGIVLITSDENKKIFEKLGFKKTANYMRFK